MTGLQVFNFESHEVRTVVDVAGEPWWVAADVCRILEYANPRQAVAKLDDDEKGVSSVDTLGGPQEMVIVNESGLYSLVLTSRKPEAKRFKKWVTSEVLPTIRHTGRYMAPAKDPILAQIEALADIRRQQLEHDERLAIVETKVDAALAGARGDTGFMTLVGFCNIRHIHKTRAELARVGALLRKRCDAVGIPIRTLPDEHWGKVNLWPVALLEEWAGQLPG